ncbi:uncharacterized protein ACNLHF_020484 [Anomaloglossus baeobatrachus]|uniref:uncharacterized protein LOC142311380 n=1 Tax=Anomaloglossus baeobatrachus TaxID=238106 RepID=UPI003F50ADFA
MHQVLPCGILQPGLPEKHTGLKHKVSCRPENIGYPFLISVPESRLTYSRLAQLLEGYARYSVNVFQPPFLPGRTSPEQPPQPLSPEKPDVPSQPSCTSSEDAFEGVRDSRSAQSGPLGPSQCPSLQPELGDSKAQGKTCVERHSLLSTDSGFSEQSSDTLRERDSGVRKRRLMKSPSNLKVSAIHVTDIEGRSQLRRGSYVSTNPFRGLVYTARGDLTC